MFQLCKHIFLILLVIYLDIVFVFADLHIIKERSIVPGRDMDTPSAFLGLHDKILSVCMSGIKFHHILIYIFKHLCLI